MNPRIRPRRPASIGSNQASPANSPCSAAALLLSLSMAWSPPALERRSWLVEQAGDYATQISHHTRDGTHRLEAEGDSDVLMDVRQRCAREPDRDGDVHDAAVQQRGVGGFERHVSPAAHGNA